MYDIALALFILLGFHMVADYPLQGDFLSQNKGRNNYLLFCHSMIYAFVMLIGLIICGTPYNELLLASLTILTSHIAIDAWKCGRQDKSKALTTDLYIDQSLHIIINSLVFIVANIKC